MKKIIIYLLNISLMNLVGCYYQEQMNPGVYNFDENFNMVVTTKDTTYTLLAEDYHLENDTLFAKISKQIDTRTTYKLKINIPKSEIKRVEVEKTDNFASMAAAIGVLTVLISIIGVIGLAESGWL